MKIRLPKIKLNSGRQLILLVSILVIIGIIWASVSMSANNRMVESVEVSYFERVEPIMKEDALLKDCIQPMAH